MKTKLFITLFIAFVLLLIYRIIIGYTPLFWFYVVGSIGFMVLVALNPVKKIKL